MKKCISIVTVLLFAALSAQAQRKPENKKKLTTGKAVSSKDRKTIANKSATKTNLRRSADPTKDAASQDIVSSDVFSVAVSHYSAAKAIKEVNNIAQVASKVDSQVHKELAENYLTFLAEATGTGKEFDVLTPEMVTEAVSKWGETEAGNLAKIFTEVTKRARDNGTNDINSSFKDLLKELGIEEAFKKYCQG